MPEKTVNEITKSKSLSQEFIGVSVDERALSEIATIVNDVAKQYNDIVAIKVGSADGEDTFHLPDPSYFENSKMPRQIASVSISFEKYNAPVSCRVELRAFPDAHARISIGGSDTTTVAGTYHELEKKLKEKPCIFSKWLHNWARTSLTIISLLTALAIYLLFDLVLGFAGWMSPGFERSQLYAELVKVAWLCVFIGAIVGGIWVYFQCQKAFPVVQFSGNLSDPSSVKRRRLGYIFSVIVLPLAVKIVASLLVKMLK